MLHLGAEAIFAILLCVFCTPHEAQFNIHDAFTVHYGLHFNLGGIKRHSLSASTTAATAPTTSASDSTSTPQPPTNENDLATLDAFTSAFKDGIKSSPVLVETFDLNKANHSDIVSGYNKTVRHYGNRFGGHNAASEANLILKRIADNVEHLSPPQLLVIYSNMVANFLMSLEIMTVDNAGSLVQQYLNLLEEELKVQQNRQQQRRRRRRRPGYVAALARTVCNFLTSLGVKNTKVGCKRIA